MVLKVHLRRAGKMNCRKIFSIGVFVCLVSGLFPTSNAIADQGIGACCDPITGICLGQMPQSQCPGIWQGPDSTCGQCQQPMMGACCFPDGRCMDLTTGDCIAQGGIPGGPGTTCATYVCPQPQPITITCPNNITVPATGPSGAVVTYTVTAGGGCSPPPMIICDPPSGSTFPIGTTVVNCTASDTCNHIADCTFTVTVTPMCTPHFFASNILPPLNGRCNCESSLFANYASGVILIKNWSARAFTAGIVPPPPGSPVTHNFGSHVEFEISFNGGTTYTSIRANAANTVQWTYQSSSGGEDIYKNEVLQMDISGGDLPAGVMIREDPSPIKSSIGETHIKPVPGGYMISSFFDVFTEISTDYGSSWMPSSGSGLLDLKVDPEFYPPAAAPRTVLPMPNGEHASPSGAGQAYADGIVIKNIRQKLFTSWQEPPTLGLTHTNTYDLQIDFDYSTDGGATYMPRALRQR